MKIQKLKQYANTHNEKQQQILQKAYFFLSKHEAQTSVYIMCVPYTLTMLEGVLHHSKKQESAEEEF